MGRAFYVLLTTNSNLIEYNSDFFSMHLKTESYTYDNLDRITGITDNGTLTTYSYDLNGRLVQKNMPGGQTATYSYNYGGMLTDVVYPGKSFYADYYYNGMKASESFDGVYKGYGYDSQGRLTTVFGTNGPDEIFTYDVYGNRLSKTVKEGDNTYSTYSYNYDGNNRLISETKDSGETNEETRSFSYDNRGNLLREIKALSETEEYEKNYTYNILGQLTAYSNGETQTTYEYLYDGLRVNKNSGELYTDYIWNGNNLAYEETLHGRVFYSYDMTGIVSADIYGDKYYYLKDIHGNIASTVNENGVSQETMTYSAFGEMSGNDFPLTSFGYCGEYLDSESGLIYLRNRYYDPSIGRFISEDPARDGLNWYVYCGNNPVGYIDPTGYITEEEQKMYESGQMSQDVYDILMDLTDRYYQAETQAGRDEIHNLAEQFRNNDYKYQDLTNEANSQLWENGQKIYLMRNAGINISTNTIALAGTGLKWYSLVDNDKEWDYKENPAPWMSKEEYFMMYGKLISFADFGNINYGYTGTILGLSPKTLYKGAGYVQSGKINDNANQYYGDSEVDFGNVNKGIEWANGLGYVGIISLPLEVIFGIREAITP